MVSGMWNAVLGWVCQTVAAYEKPVSVIGDEDSLRGIEVRVEDGAGCGWSTREVGQCIKSAGPLNRVRLSRGGGCDFGRSMG